MKRIISLLLAVLLLFGMTACSSSSGPSLSDKLKERPVEHEKREKPDRDHQENNDIKQPTDEPVKTDTPPDAPYDVPPTEEPADEPVEVPVENPEDIPAEDTPETTADYTVFDGIYRKEQMNSDGNETYVIVRGFPDFILLEYFDVYEGSVYSFQAEEFWPDANAAVAEVPTSVQGKSQNFSIMSRGNEYMELPRGRTITLTEDGVILQFDGMEEERFVADDSFDGGHSSQETMWETLNMVTNIELSESPVGSWGYSDGWTMIRLVFAEDGGFHFYQKEVGRPVHVLDGAWGLDQETGEIYIMAEMAGEGKYPYLITWQWEVDEYGFLNLSEESETLLGSLDGAVSLWQVDSDATIDLRQVDAMGYFYSYYDVSGEYTDQYNTTYYYSYCLPQFLEDTGDMAEINREIMESFAPVVEEELAAMEQQEFLTCDSLDWYTSVYDDILILWVYAYSYEWETHQTYYYDLQAEKRVDSRELLSRLDITEEEFVETVKAAAETCYIEMFSGLPEEDREAYGYYEMLEWTVSDEAVNLDLPIIVDMYGNIIVLARIGSLAGASEFWYPLYPFETVAE